MVYVYTHTVSDRLIYTADFIFKQVLQTDYKILREITKTTRQDVYINYTDEAVDGYFNVKPVGLIDKIVLEQQNIEYGNWRELKTIFHTGESDLPFDIFSAVFYFISRYEEYLTSEPDQFDRFKAENSLAYRLGIVKEPIVDQWIMEFARKTGIPSPVVLNPEKFYSTKLTIDVDHPWKFKNRSVMINTLAVIRLFLLLRLKQFFERLAIHFNRKTDPGYTFGYLEDIQRKLKNKITFFILAGEMNEYDNKIDRNCKEFISLIRELDRNQPVGIHPSFKSNDSFQKLEEEYKWLVDKLGHPVIRSRQHFLKMKLPETYQNLIKLGIEEDYTMGWSSISGFRAGTSRSFYFYDLKEERATTLKLVPFQAMDRTYLSYMNLSPNEAIDDLKVLHEKVQAVGGTLTTLWHNDSLSDFMEWNGWKRVFEQYIDLATA